MSRNPILDELHSVREKLLADAGNDLHQYILEANQRALASGHLIAQPNVRTKPVGEAVKSCVAGIQLPLPSPETAKK